MKRALIALYGNEDICIPNLHQFVSKIHRLQKASQQIDIIADFDFTLTCITLIRWRVIIRNTLTLSICQ